MKPLFSPRCDLLGWIDPGAAIFDTEMNYVAFVADGHAWSPLDCNWLGSVDVLTVFDRSGRAVAWNPGVPCPAFPAGTHRTPHASQDADATQTALAAGAPAVPENAPDGMVALTFEEWLGRSRPGLGSECRRDAVRLMDAGNEKSRNRLRQSLLCGSPV